MTRPDTRISIEPFGGMIPAVATQLLPNENAEVSENTWLYDGKIRGFRVPRLVHNLTNPTARTVYRIPLAGPLAVNIPTSLWLEFAGLETSVVKNPNTNTIDELYYWAGDTPLGPPEYNALSRMLSTPPVDPLLLGVPSPTANPGVIPAGGVSLVTEARSYVYTYVTPWGEEGPPSNPTPVVTGKVDDTWAVSMPDAPTDRGPVVTAITGITQAVQGVVTSVAHGLAVGNRVYFRNVTGMTQINGLYATVVGVGGPNVFTININTSAFTAYAAAGDVGRIDRELVKKRIYRTITSAQGIASFFFVNEVAINITSYNDTALSATVAANEQLTTFDYDPPPTDLEGFTTMPNGMIIGWRGNEVWFSEPFQPHAWPTPYQTSVDFDIVGIGVVGQTAVLCTQGAPYTISGVHPSQMASARVSALPYPCVSKNSIVATPQGVFYGAAPGLIMVTSGGPVVATEKIFETADVAQFMSLPRLAAALLNNGAYFYFSGVGEGCFQADTFQNDAFELTDFSGTMNGGIIDFNDKRIAFNQLTSTTPTYNVIQDPWTTEVLFIRGTAVYQVDLTSAAEEGGYRWKSKIYRTDVPTNLGVGIIFWNTPPSQPGATATLNVYAARIDENSEPLSLIYSVALPTSGREFRLPAGVLYDFYQFELIGNVQVQNMQFATTPKELRGV